MTSAILMLDSDLVEIRHDLFDVKSSILAHLALIVHHTHHTCDHHTCESDLACKNYLISKWMKANAFSNIASNMPRSLKVQICKIITPHLVGTGMLINDALL